MSGKEMRVSPGAEVGEREKGRGVKDGEELIVAVMDNEEKKEKKAKGESVCIEGEERDEGG